MATLFGNRMRVASSRIAVTSAAGATRGAIAATKQDARMSATRTRPNTNAIALSRTLRIGRSFEARPNGQVTQTAQVLAKSLSVWIADRKFPASAELDL